MTPLKRLFVMLVSLVALSAFAAGCVVEDENDGEGDGTDVNVDDGNGEGDGGDTVVTDDDDDGGGDTFIDNDGNETS